MTFNLFNRLILWFRKIFCIRPKLIFLVKKLLAKILPTKEKEPSEEEEPKEDKISITEPSQIDHPVKEKAETKTQKPSIVKTPIEIGKKKEEGRKSLENEKEKAISKRIEKIDLGRTKRKKLSSAKQPAKVNIKRINKISEGKETPTRVESPFIEIDLNEAKVFLVLPKQQFKPNAVSNIPQQLKYKLELDGEEQTIFVKVSMDNQGTAEIEEKRIELVKSLKSFQIVLPDELQDRTYKKAYSYNHNYKNLYAFVAIGNNWGRMKYLYDADGNINPLPHRMVWLLLHEDFKLEIESNYLPEETWIWEQYRPFRVNLKEMDELIIKNTKTSKECKLPCEPTFSIEGQVIEDDFKDQMPLLIGETFKIKAPRGNPYGWTVWIQNKIAGYRIITENWSGVEPLSLRLPDDLPCEGGEFQVDICQQDSRIPDETLFFRWLPFIELNYPKELIIPNPRQGHKSAFINVKVSGEEWALNYGVDRKVGYIESNSVQIEIRPEKNTVRFSITKKGKPEILTKFKITIPRLKWKTSKYEAWNGKFQNIKRDELIYGESCYLFICTNDFNNRYDLSAILETNGQRLQGEKFNQQGINYNLELNQFYDTIKQNKNALRLKIEICRTKDYKLLGSPEVLYFDAKQAIQKPSPTNIVSYDLINTLSLPKVCFVLHRIKTICPKEKLACKEVLQLYYQEIKTKKRTKKNISMYKKAFVIRSLAIIKFIIGNYVDKIPIKGQKKWKRRIVLLQQTYPGELKNVFDSLIRGDKYAP